MSEYPDRIAHSTPRRSRSADAEILRLRRRLNEVECVLASMRKVISALRRQNRNCATCSARVTASPRVFHGKPHVYVVLDGRGRLKVGKTANIDRRIGALRTAIPDLQLLRAEPGYTAAERALQNTLKPFHVAGEWFQDCAETRDIVERWNVVQTALA